MFARSVRLYKPKKLLKLKVTRLRVFSCQLNHQGWNSSVSLPSRVLWLSSCVIYFHISRFSGVTSSDVQFFLLTDYSSTLRRLIRLSFSLFECSTGNSSSVQWYSFVVVNLKRENQFQDETPRISLSVFIASFLFFEYLIGSTHYSLFVLSFSTLRQVRESSSWTMSDLSSKLPRSCF